ncbi:K+-transporting ATPase, C subunit [Methanocella conradii HZ254]|uniref:Potassium-transporting ATPase KdpC subunit n=1 Tax=Methanocella conradii (strain DSM 24694 / JCM 17849 / CGMCC 1.5162 / HZ254) TaxID=1041930 RepID=H8I6H1_METCZ|nr:potassium-transporting ATPase subunit KdpC [Methanocella conradii]AFD01169.1 K+-transporting ATPase, C subunit [Methanocella conradii HZ254]
MNYLKLIYPSVSLAALAVLACGVLYPLAITLVAGAAFPWQAGGSPLTHDGNVVGSALIGQNFTGPGCFHSRPSAVGYDALGSGASNLGPSNPALLSKVESRTLHGVSSVPGDAVLGSGSGLDPDISVENAMMQVPRVAAESGLGEDTVRSLVQMHTRGRLLGLWGEPRVNVLELNLALERISK